MSLRYEWRTRIVLDGDAQNDALVVIDERDGTVVRFWPVSPELLIDYLNEMETLTSAEAIGASSPQAMKSGNWGDLVVARGEAGDVLFVDPELYWDGIATWFRSHGSDPHLWRRVGSRLISRA